MVSDGNLYCRADKNIPQCLVIDSEERRVEIIAQLHDEYGHKGRESTYQRVTDRYYWNNYYSDVKAFMAGYERCQL